MKIQLKDLKKGQWYVVTEDKDGYSEGYEEVDWLFKYKRISENEYYGEDAIYAYMNKQFSLSPGNSDFDEDSYADDFVILIKHVVKIRKATIKEVRSYLPYEKLDISINERGI